ncbi:MAG: DUF4838 domain-containing protein, partial [Abditibacteriaceae bacterium]
TAAVEKNALVIVDNGNTSAQVVVAPDAGEWEKQAANDLVKYITMMSGATPTLDNTAASAAAAMDVKTPVLIVGQAALKADPSLQAALDKVKKKDPIVRADAIVVRREGNRVLLAGTDDQSQYYAVSWLLQQWGCHWYMPTDFGECIPVKKTITVGDLDYAYAPPFEIRNYWISWNGDATGATEFQRRNFMSDAMVVGNGQTLEEYTKSLIPPGKSAYNVPFSDPKTAEVIAKEIAPDYAAGKSISLSVMDGNYFSDSPTDKALIAEYDSDAMLPSMTDAMLTLYNNVGKILLKEYPDSKAKIGGMAYENMTLPPKIVKTLEPNIMMWIAPIAVDPIHGMDDPKSPARQEYKVWLDKWAKLTGGRLALYDYDQGMLVWRDLPNPSQQSFEEDVKHYRDAGILGISTESRGATATTFLNLYFRGQLMWNPDADTDKMLSEFYPSFYGPAAAPMADYWNSIFAAWKNTIVTEHEYFLAPAIYTPELVATLKKNLADAEAKMQPLQGRTDLTRNEKQYLERMKFTSLSFDVIQNYIGMVNSADGQDEFAKAAAFGDKALAAREELTAMSGTFTTYKVAGEHGPAWFPGHVQQMKDLATLTDGTKGTLIAKTPLEWSFHRGAPVPADWQYKGMEGGVPNDSTLAIQEPTAANGWQPLRTDLYMQAQGILNPDGSSYSGHYWYQTPLNLDANQTTGNVHLMFPGLFNEAWLYVNGKLVAHRDYKEPWWMEDYTFEWDVDLTGKLKPGKNVIALRGFNPNHFGGMFRRPFLYQAVK